MPNKAKRLLREGKITKDEYNAIILRDEEFHSQPTPPWQRERSESELEVDAIPWARLSKVFIIYLFAHVIYVTLCVTG